MADIYENIVPTQIRDMTLLNLCKFKIVLAEICYVVCISVFYVAN